MEHKKLEITKQLAAQKKETQKVVNIQYFYYTQKSPALCLYSYFPLQLILQSRNTPFTIQNSFQRINFFAKDYGGMEVKEHRLQKNRDSFSYCLNFFLMIDATVTNNGEDSNFWIRSRFGI